MTEKKINPVLNFARQNLVFCAIIVLIVVTAIVEPKFLSSANLGNVMRQLGALPFAALGMTFVITAGFIDLSIPGIIGLVGVITIGLIDPIGQVPALIVGILLGAALGFLNGCILTFSGAMTQAEVLFITYGMSSVYIALALIFTQSETLRLANSSRSFALFTALGSTSIGIVPIIIVIFIIILIIMHLFLTRTIWGRSICLLGGNKDAAYLCGFQVKNTMRLSYTINGLMAGLASIALLCRVTTATANSGSGYETDAILCVVVGGTSLKGGKGSVLRTMVGVVLITLLGNCMNMLGLSTYMQTIMRGAVLVIAIWLDNRRQL